MPISATDSKDARRVVEQAEIVRLARADQIRFAEALVNPAKANQKRAGAARRHAQLFGVSEQPIYRERRGKGHWRNEPTKDA